ncbi:hypothetical protein E3Q06_01018 [Wallemia mellicola]|uniref:Inhibitor of growth protein N-terminal histone-binding domain-containing protein n=1 Tax=Wallemia mellicola TaxID=1708541 RepID=A0AB38MMS1_9BASI|nr:hypothetical protein E3Q21_01117 [Wallemia mellicola]TIB90810.1 hypothetical protein E3Q20_01104 [Wallemia mellicola]TIC42668.1 hypothetical protein E3Q07_01014 [Wallemia mellicola]TIC51324.1 hypothetical protein E3Q06_01018 [Wallemia mellicola]TIC55245.1 hypothetical protein E3Q04_01780 [Wallemia mellicola]
MASTSAGPSTHELHSLNLLNTYVDTLDALPIELSRHFHEMRELDANLSNSADQTITQLNKLTLALEDESLSPKERFLALRDVSDTIKQYKLNQEEKIKLGTAACETMLAHTEYTDQVLLHFLLHDPSLFPPAPLFPPSGTNLQRLFARAMLTISPNAINGRRRALQPPPGSLYGESRKRPLSSAMNQQTSNKVSSRRVPTISGAGPRGGIGQRRNDSPISNSPNPSEYYGNKATTVRQIEKTSQRRPNNGQLLYSPPPSPYQYAQIPQVQPNYVVQQQTYQPVPRMAETTNGYNYAQEPSYDDIDNPGAGGDNDADEARSSSVPPRHSRQSSYSIADDSQEDVRRSRTPSKQTHRQPSKSTLRHSTTEQPDEETSSEEYRQPNDEPDQPDDEVPSHELTLKDRQNAINIEHPFGLPIWKPALYKKSRSVTVAADNALHSEPTSHPSSFTLANIAWFILAGWWLSLLCYFSVAVLFLFERSKSESLWVTLLYDLAWYISWPFGGKYVEGAGRDPESEDEENLDETPRQTSSQNNENTSLLPPQRSGRLSSYGAVFQNINQHKRLPESESKLSLSKWVYYTVLVCILSPPLLIVSALSFFTVIPIPMGKLLYELIGYLYTSPTQIRFRPAPKVLVPAANQDNEEEQTNRFTVPKLKAGQSLPPSRHGETSTVLLCVYNAGSTRYYKFTVGGVNIFFVNLMPLVFLVILDAYLLQPYVERKGITTASVIPLSYFIGMAVASISAQSSIGVGSVINATFGSLIEILIYSFALMDSKSSLVEGSLVGSVLAGVLLMPGVSMCAGAFRRKELRFNAKAAGVTSTMLIMAIIGTLTPTLFYQTYGSSQLVCKGCPKSIPLDKPWSCKRCFYQHVDPHTDPFYQGNVKHLISHIIKSYLVGLWFSLRTHASQIWQNPQQLMQQMEGVQNTPSHVSAIHPHHRASFFKKGGLPTTNEPPQTPKKASTARPASTTLQKPAPQLHMQASANNIQMRGSQPTLIQMPSSMAGEDFSRAIVAEDPTRPPSMAQSVPEGSLGGAPPSTVQPHEDHGGHEAPEWSRTTSSTVLLTCTLLYAAIAEILVDEVDVVLEGATIPEKFLGISLFALVPNTTEFMNAMSFAINGNIALSMEISSAYALQVCLLQIPAMVLFSALTTNVDTPPSNVFVLIFPRWDAIAIIFAVFLLTYMLTESRSNYYRGTILILSYLVLTAGFYFAPTRSNENFEDFSSSSLSNDLVCTDENLTFYQKTFLRFQSIFLM